MFSNRKQRISSTHLQPHNDWDLLCIRIDLCFFCFVLFLFETISLSLLSESVLVKLILRVHVKMIAIVDYFFSLMSLIYKMLMNWNKLHFTRAQSVFSTCIFCPTKFFLQSYFFLLHQLMHTQLFT